MDPHQIEEERELMFEKSLTPSDVGKLNRLVIPKQHAEKYFPIAREKSFLLNFEDESGKEWPFRYSFWTSSQSYVLTKGWSRYIKEKRLDVRDVVVFQRCHRDQHLYIGFRRRGDSPITIVPSGVTAVPKAVLPWSQLCNTSSLSPSDSSIYSSVEQECRLHEGSSDRTVAARPLNPNRVRLFGVNLD